MDFSPFVTKIHDRSIDNVHDPKTKGPKNQPITGKKGTSKAQYNLGQSEVPDFFKGTSPTLD